MGAWFAISQVLARYVHVVDEKAWERLDEVFTADAVIDHTGVGSLMMRGLGEAAEGFAAGMARHPIAHHVTNSLVEGVSEDGNTVRVQSKWLVVDEEGVARTGYYQDEFVKRSGDWRIASRTATKRFV